MQRVAYIYRIVPLMVALSCGKLLEGLLGGTGALIVGMAIVLAAWGVVWFRLYGMRRLRPEFAVLTILPHAVYFILKACSADVLAAFSTPAWQNMYFVAWLVAMGTLVFSLRPGYHDDRRRVKQDSMFIMMTILTIVYGVTTWANYAGDLFRI